MFKASQIISRSGLVRIVCALALLGVAFAHRPLTLLSTQAEAAELTSFVLPDGTLPDLCLAGDDNPHHQASNHCEACRIVASADLPSPMGTYVLARWDLPTQLSVPQASPSDFTLARRSALPRAPPALTA